MATEKNAELSKAGSSQPRIVTLSDKQNNKHSELKILHSEQGPDVIDISHLYQDTGYFTFDPGFTSTASCDSAITFIDGEKGILQHRGYSIEDLANNSDYLEVAYLLLEGELPSQIQRATFDEEIAHHTMAIMVGVVGALSAFYHDSLDIHDEQQRHLASMRLLAKMPTIASMAFKYTQGQPFIFPSNKLSYAENFLRMTFSVPADDYVPNPVLSQALDRIFILHADHEQNASTSTVRLAGSSQANPFACIAAGIASLWGPAHGGANEAVLKMLDEIGDIKRIPEFIARAKDKQDPFRLMGFGHRVYKNYDPRAKVLRDSAHAVLEQLGALDQPLFELAMELERIALEDDYFIEKKLFPNVDFYSGIVLKAMGFPTSMFTVLFAMARTAGWVSQWNEMIGEPVQKIGRPRQRYTGYGHRDYILKDKR